MKCPHCFQQGGVKMWVDVENEEVTLICEFCNYVLDNDESDNKMVSKDNKKKSYRYAEELIVPLVLWLGCIALSLVFPFVYMYYKLTEDL